MDGTGLVFIGMDVVADALDIAEARRWLRARAPRGLWRLLGVGTGVVVRHPDAPIQVALVAADTSLRGVGDIADSDIRLAFDRDRFDEVVDDCPVVDVLVKALLASDAPVASR